VHIHTDTLYLCRNVTVFLKVSYSVCVIFERLNAYNVAMDNVLKCITVYSEIFVVCNFHSFHGWQSYHEILSHENLCSGTRER